MRHWVAAVSCHGTARFFLLTSRKNIASVTLLDEGLRSALETLVGDTYLIRIVADVAKPSLTASFLLHDLHHLVRNGYSFPGFIRVVWEAMVVGTKPLAVLVRLGVIAAAHRTLTVEVKHPLQLFLTLSCRHVHTVHVGGE